MTAIALTVNGKPVEAEVEPRTTLADFLREHLLLTGTHIGCEHGVCGACTIEINGEIARSCITYAVQCDGAEVRTIESFDADPLMARLRKAFSEEHALQCGYCTPGMLIAARDLIRRKGGLSEREIRVEMSGNLCRCTGYVGIVRAIQGVMAEREAFDIPRAPTAWLGPAPGPETPSAKTATMPTAATAPRSAVAAAGKAWASPASVQLHAAPITTGAIGAADGFTRLAQSIVVRHPRDAVWRYMADIVKIAACMPGASLDHVGDDGRVAGRMAVHLGPIAASFAGEGTVTRTDGDYRGVIEGHGRDTKSASRARGRIEYRLSEDGREATRVDVAITYALAGPLAQFGRSSLVRDLVGRLARTFAQNLETRLADPEAAATPAKLNALALLGSVLWARIRALFSGRA